jgi:hypothetical protein
VVYLTVLAGANGADPARFAAMQREQREMASAGPK